MAEGTFESISGATGGAPIVTTEQLEEAKLYADFYKDDYNTFIQDKNRALGEDFLRLDFYNAEKNREDYGERLKKAKDAKEDAKIEVSEEAKRYALNYPINFNIFKSKIRFTYEPIPEIFKEIASNAKENIGQIFEEARKNMQNFSAGEAWEKAVQTSETNLTKEDLHVLLMLSKMLGQTDVEGQISQIEITENFLEKQIKEAQQEKNKNEKLYRKLGTTIGLAIVIILI